MNSPEDRVDASMVDPGELQRLSEVVESESGRPRLVGREGVEIELPDAIFHLLVTVVRNMQKGRAMVLMPEDETFTTQAAANFLGVSRQFLVDLVDAGKIPHHRVGSHRRICLERTCGRFDSSAIRSAAQILIPSSTEFEKQVALDLNQP